MSSYPNLSHNSRWIHWFQCRIAKEVLHLFVSLLLSICPSNMSSRSLSAVIESCLLIWQILHRGKKTSGTGGEQEILRPSSSVRLVQAYLAGQLGHLSGQIDVWAVGQRTATAGLLPRFVAVADLKAMGSNNPHQREPGRSVGLLNIAYATTWRKYT